MTNKKAFVYAKSLVEFCNEQGYCQNCIFRRYSSDAWKCHINVIDLREILSNIEAKKKKHGYI